MSDVFSLALRPSHPHVCRKRASGQGQALAGRFAGRDLMPLLSGYGYSRATDEEASGGGSVKGSAQARSTKAATQKSVSRHSRHSCLPARGDTNTCKAVPACAPQSYPDTYKVASRPPFRCPRRHVRHAGHSMRRILIERSSDVVQSFPASSFPENRVVIPCPRRTHQGHIGYDSVPRPIRIRHILDARITRPRFCTDAWSFVRPCLRGPAYVSSIRSAYSLTAGEGRGPFEPRKTQRQGKR